LPNFEVLTRRDQLAASEGKEKVKGKGKGKNKGKGRPGKGRGKKADPDDPMPASEEPKKRKQKGKGKGDSDADTSGGKRQKKSENTKDVKPAEKKAPRKKRGSGEPKAEMEAPLDDGSSGTQPQPPQKASTSKRQKPQASEPESEAKGKPANPKSEDGSGIRVVDDVMNKLESYRYDETKWSSLTALYQAMVGEQPSRQNDLVPRYLHYNLSMYWTKGRVGLLDKEKNHILSFSSASTHRIGLPLRATMLYVSCSP